MLWPPVHRIQLVNLTGTRCRAIRRGGRSYSREPMLMPVQAVNTRNTLNEGRYIRSAQDN